MEPENHEERVQLVFDSYIKRILKDESNGLKRQLARRVKRLEYFPFSEMTDRDMASAASTDRYFADDYVFEILGESVEVSDAGLAEALSGLTAEKREIVLMKFFFEMTDREIAEKLDKARRTVASHRANALLELRKLIERED